MSSSNTVERWRARRVRPALIAQGMIALGGAALLMLAPPADGPMLLVPLSTHAGARAMNVALAEGATLLGAGPWPGTFVLRVPRGGRTALTPRAGVLMLAAAPLLCRAGRA